MGNRRMGDRMPRLVAASAGGLRLLNGDVELTPDPSPEDRLLLLDPGGSHLLLVGSADIGHIARGRGGDELARRVAAAAAHWTRERMRTKRLVALAGSLLVLGEELSRAGTAAEVFGALLEHARNVLGGYEALCLSRAAGNGSHAWHLLRGGAQAIALPAIAAGCGAVPRFPALVRRSDLEDATDQLGCLTPLFEETRADAIAVAAMGETDVLVIAERRRDRPFEGEDWYVLRTIARQGEAALERVRLRSRLKGGAPA